MDTRHLAQQLPAIHHVFSLNLIPTQHIDGCQYILGVKCYAGLT
ncbi:hypothetical protein [Pseudomonas simiae]|nr:hypothetical protein [Pseudomonas simiae]WLI01031.1 hypothetical protein PSH95_27405 [Pseudomonas simiae]